MATIFDGKKQAAVKEKILAQKVAQNHLRLKLVNIVVGDDPGSLLYLRVKQKAAVRVGIDYEKKLFPADTKPAAIGEFVRRQNADPAVTGIMFQQPFPKDSRLKIQDSRILNMIDPKKDVDCLTPTNLGLLLMGRPRFLPATVKAIVEIIENCLPHKALAKWGKLEIRSFTAVVLGVSNIVGKPLASHLTNLGATMTVCRSKTKDLAAVTRQADILISATGQPGLVGAEMVKKGAAVIDVGSPQGDVAFDQVAPLASFVTPVPGGVGPMTVVCLLENVLQAGQAA